MIPYEDLARLNQPYEASFRETFDNFIKKGRYILDSEVEKFEQEFAEFCGSPYCIGVASGFDAIYLPLLALDLPKGSEVLVPSNTYIATIFAVMQAGLKPVLVEPRLDSYNIDPEKISLHLSPKTKAIVVVHLYGKPCEMEAIKSVTDQVPLALIEDCAQAHGASISGQKVGTFGLAGAFSFYPTKNLGALGDAGAITTADKDFAEKLRALRNYGSEKKYHNLYQGINSRLDELQAAFLRLKLRHINEINDHKRMLANLYLSKIRNTEFILPLAYPGKGDVWHIFNIRHPRRDDLKKYLLENDIQTEIHYPLPPHSQTACKGMFRSSDFPISEEIHRTTLSLPISGIHTPEDVAYIAEVLNRF